MAEAALAPVMNRAGHRDLSALMPLDQRACLTRRTPRTDHTLRQASKTFAEVPNGKTTSHVLGVLAHLLDSAGPR